MEEETSTPMTDEEAMSMDEAAMGNVDEAMEPSMPSDEPGMMDDPGMMAEPSLEQPVAGCIPRSVSSEPDPMEQPVAGCIPRSGASEPDLMEPWMDMPQGVTLVPAPEGAIDPGTFEAHPLTDHMPVKSDSEYEALKESIRINGLQQPVTRFEGQILDGRHRLRACCEVGIPVAVMDLIGSPDDALVYVLQSNQYHHDYSVSQRAAVAALLLPDIAERVAQGRLERVRAAWDAKRDIGCSPNLGNNQESSDSRTRSHAIAGAMLRVSRGYVEYAVRIQREAPELFGQLHAGMITMQAALKTLSGEVNDAQEREVRAARSDLNRALRNLDKHPDFLKQFREFMAQFAE